MDERARLPRHRLAIAAGVAAGLVAVGATAAPVVYTTGPGLDLDIPDDDAAGISSTIEIADNATIIGVAVAARVDHTWVGDLIFTLTAPDGTVVTLADQPGEPAEPAGDSSNLTTERAVLFADVGTVPAEQLGAGCDDSDTVVGFDCTRFVAPEEALGVLAGLSTEGTWTLSISDNQGLDTGFLDQWYIGFNVAPIPAPAAFLLFGSALIAGGAATRRRA